MTDTILAISENAIEISFLNLFSQFKNWTRFPYYLQYTVQNSQPLLVWQKNDLCKNKMKKIKTTQTKEKKQILGAVRALNEHYTNAFVFVESREKQKESYLLEISRFFFSFLY